MYVIATPSHTPRVFYKTVYCHERYYTLIVLIIACRDSCVLTGSCNYLKHHAVMYVKKPKRTQKFSLVHSALIQTGFLQSMSPTHNFCVKTIITEWKSVDIRKVIWTIILIFCKKKLFRG